MVQNKEKIEYIAAYYSATDKKLAFVRELPKDLKITMYDLCRSAYLKLDGYDSHVIPNYPRTIPETVLYDLMKKNKHKQIVIDTLNRTIVMNPETIIIVYNYRQNPIKKMNGFEDITFEFNSS